MVVEREQQVLRNLLGESSSSPDRPCPPGALTPYFPIDRPRIVPQGMRERIGEGNLCSKLPLTIDVLCVGQKHDLSSLPPD
jgi:hypothetical protein